MHDDSYEPIYQPDDDYCWIDPEESVWQDEPHRSLGKMISTYFFNGTVRIQTFDADGKLLEDRTELAPVYESEEFDQPEPDEPNIL